MLIPLLLTHLQAGPKWTGEVHAFALFCTTHCIPQERLDTVYVARKTYEDGSTSTLVRAVPAATKMASFIQDLGEGRIERDPQGVPTRIARQSLNHERGGFLRFGTTDSPARRSERMDTGAIDLGPLDHRPVNPDTDYVIDPLEWIVYGAPRGSSNSWHIPAVNERFDASGLSYYYTLLAPVRSNRDLGGRREMFTIVQVARMVTVNNGAARKQIPAGTLWYHQDGTLAAFAEVPDSSVYPSQTAVSLGYVPEGIQDPWATGYLVPTSVSLAERSAILSEV